MKNYSEVKYKKESFFTYGNAQKWVNMTVKYICIFDALKPIKEFQPQIQKNANEYHVPIDSYIINAVWKIKDSKEEPVPLPTIKERKAYTNPSDYVTPWSRWNEVDNQGKCSDYDNFQNRVKRCIGDGDSTLDWENRNWIDAAKKRKESIQDIFANKFSNK